MDCYQFVISPSSLDEIEGIPKNLSTGNASFGFHNSG